MIEEEREEERGRKREKKREGRREREDKRTGGCAMKKKKAVKETSCLA